MSRLRAWTWKEAREHRWALFGVWLAVALITSLPFLVAREETTRDTLDHLPGVAVALATLVLGLDLFARESRRSTHALILRTPGAMRWAFPAKLLLFALGTLGALAIEEALRHPLETVTGIPRPYGLAFFEGEWRRFDRKIRPDSEFGIPLTLYLGCLAAAVGVWHVAGSVASPRAGVGALCGVLALGVLCVPFMLLYEQHPWWFRPSSGEAYAWIAAIGGAGLLVAAVGWYSGRRFLFPRKAAALRGGVTAVILFGLATGAAAYAIDRWEAADPRAPEFRIESGFLGAGGKTLYLTTSRGSLYGNQFHGERQSPAYAWTIALDDPTGRDSDVRRGAWFREPPGAVRMRSLVPLPFVVRVDQALPRSTPWTERWTWIDTSTQGVRLTGGANTLTRETIAMARATAQAQTPFRDSKGRRVWWVEETVERDGDEDRVPTPAGTARRGGAPVATLATSGFVVEGYGFGAPRIDDRLSFQRLRIEAESGETTTDVAQPAGTWGRVDLGGGTYLVGRTPEVPGAAPEPGWFLWDARQPDRLDATPGPPPAKLVLPPVGSDLALVLEDPPEGTTNPSTLALWRPSTGERTAVTCADPRYLGPESVSVWGVLPEGRQLLAMYEGSAPQLGRQALALLDPKAGTIVPVAPWADARWMPLAFDVDGSLLAIEDARRVVRLSDAGRKRELVWPK